MIPFSSFVLHRGAATVAELEESMRRQTLRGGDLGTHLLGQGALDEEQLLALLAEYHDLPLGPVGRLPAIPAELEEILPLAIASRYQVFPLGVASSELHLATAQPLADGVAQELSGLVGQPLHQVVVTTLRLQEALWRFLGLPLRADVQEGLARLDGPDALQPPPPPPVADEEPPAKPYRRMELQPSGKIIAVDRVPSQSLMSPSPFLMGGFMAAGDEEDLGYEDLSKVEPEPAVPGQRDEVFYSSWDDDETHPYPESETPPTVPGKQAAPPTAAAAEPALESSEPKVGGHSEPPEVLVEYTEAHDLPQEVGLEDVQLDDDTDPALDPALADGEHWPLEEPVESPAQPQVRVVVDGVDAATATETDGDTPAASEVDSPSEPPPEQPLAELVISDAPPEMPDDEEVAEEAEAAAPSGAGLVEPAPAATDTREPETDVNVPLDEAPTQLIPVGALGLERSEPEEEELRERAEEAPTELMPVAALGLERPEEEELRERAEEAPTELMSVAALGVDLPEEGDRSQPESDVPWDDISPLGEIPAERHRDVPPEESSGLDSSPSAGERDDSLPSDSPPPDSLPEISNADGSVVLVASQAAGVAVASDAAGVAVGVEAAGVALGSEPSVPPRAAAELDAEEPEPETVESTVLVDDDDEPERAAEPPEPTGVEYPVPVEAAEAQPEPPYEPSPPVDAGAVEAAEPELERAAPDPRGALAEAEAAELAHEVAELEAAGLLARGAATEPQLSELHDPDPGAQAATGQSLEPPGPTSIRTEMAAQLRAHDSEAASAPESAPAFRHRGPFPRGAAEQSLAEAADVNEALEIYVRFARQYFERVLLVVVQSGCANVRMVRGMPPELASLRVELSAAGLLQRAHDEADTVICQLRSNGPDAMLLRGLRPVTEFQAAAVPVRVRKRVVALLYADDAPVDVDPEAVAEVGSFAKLVGNALALHILRRKRLEQG